MAEEREPKHNAQESRRVQSDTETLKGKWTHGDVPAGEVFSRKEVNRLEFVRREVEKEQEKGKKG